jgi:hypothetical protein
MNDFLLTELARDQLARLRHAADAARMRRAAERVIHRDPHSRRLLKAHPHRGSRH